jgi:hypothetical protein
MTHTTTTIVHNTPTHILDIAFTGGGETHNEELWVRRFREMDGLNFLFFFSHNLTLLAPGLLIMKRRVVKLVFWQLGGRVYI